MGFGDRLALLFRGKRTDTLTDSAASFFERFPDLPKAQTLSLLCFALRKFGGSSPGPEDLYALRLLLSRTLPDAEIDGILENVLAAGDSLPEALAAAEELKSSGKREARTALAGEILSFYTATVPLSPALKKTFSDLCSAMGFSGKFIEETLAFDSESRDKREKVLNSGAGLAVALVVILVFILAATYLKSVFFGFILAYLCLPLEKFFENRVFRNRFVIRISALIEKMMSPVYRLREKLSRGYGGKNRSQSETRRKMKESLVLKSSVATVISIFLCLILLLGLISFILVPKAMDVSRNINEWAKNNEFLRKTEAVVERFIKTRSGGGALPPGTLSRENASGTAGGGIRMGEMPAGTGDVSGSASAAAAGFSTSAATDIQTGPERQPRLESSAAETPETLPETAENTIPSPSSSADAALPSGNGMAKLQAFQTGEGGPMAAKEEEPVPENASQADLSAAEPDPGEELAFRLFTRENWAGLFEWLRQTGRRYFSENLLDAASLIFSNGKGLLSGIFSTAGSIGSFLFDALLGIFFFFFFLQKLALFSDAGPSAGKRGRNSKDNSVGTWVVKGIFDSGWMPDAKQSSRDEAAEIIDRISLMFNRWLKGYFSIIIIETILYSVFFALFAVPHFPILALIAGWTILLPFIGPIVSFVLTAAVCIALLESTHLMTALIGISLTYIIINGILEQLLFYPSLVGEAIGLTTLETIIVVLIGALCAGITGMIFAVPAAAVLKFLVPKIYRIWIPKKEEPRRL